MNLDKLIEAFLLEAAALTKGSRHVMTDKKLVAALAATVRDDAAINPEAFPPGSKNNFKKATDEAVAQWFLENIDAIEREGYEGTVYSHDGKNNKWIVLRYIAGSHTWEDLTGVMNMNLRDWYLLWNRDMLDVNHNQIDKFKSVRDIGFYMTTHYKAELEKVRNAEKNKARNKMSKNFKLVDNDDYRIYTAINRAAGCALGLGTQWCTANSNYGGHFHSYSGRAMLFQLFPYVTKKNAETGEEELGLSETAKYQFDAGGPTFMDITDTPVPAAKVRQTFPYIYTDLATALQKNKSKMEKAFEEWAADPTLQHEDFKIKNYEIAEEIQKLHKFVDRGYFTEEKRPSETSAEEPAGEQPQIGDASAPEQPPQEPQMETLKDLAKAMLEDKKLGHFVQQYKPLNKAGQESPMTHGGDNLDETNVDECGLGQAKQGLIAALAARSGKGQQAMGEDDAMMQDPAAGGDVGAQAATGGSLGGGTGGSGGGQYPPGTAPTMPESVGSHPDRLLARTGLNSVNKVPRNGQTNFIDIPAGNYPDTGRPYSDSDRAEQPGRLKAAIKNQLGKHPAPRLPESQEGNTVMENVDKDVAAMMASLKKYDKLNESVLGMVTLSMKPSVKEATGLPAHPTAVKFLISYLKDTTSEEASYDDWIDEGIQVTMSRFPGVTYEQLRNHPRVINYVEGDELEEDVEVQKIPYKEPRKGEKTNYGSKHIGSASGQGTKGQQRGTNANVSTGKKTGDKTALPVVKEAGPDKSSVPAAFRKEKGGDWKTSKADLDKEAGKSPTTKKGLEDLKAKKDIKESNEVDPEVLDWMNRFSKLGNMKGYGR